jgi:hypothetical protein
MLTERGWQLAKRPSLSLFLVRSSIMSSSTSTTTTTDQHWLLEKYSRSRTPSEPPSKRIKMSEGGATRTNKVEEAVEWDH